MKKTLFCLVLTAALVLGLSAVAWASTQTVEITLTKVLDKDLKIEDYLLEGESKDKTLLFEGKLIDYMVTNDITAQITFNNSKQVLTIPGKALQTSDYLAAKKSGETYGVKLEVFTDASSLVSKYFDASKMNGNGLYSAPDSAIKLLGYVTQGGKNKYEIQEFAAPLTLQSKYTWNVNTMYIPVGLGAEYLRYYYVANPEDADAYDGYTWNYVGGTVDTKKTTVQATLSHTGFYCAQASKSHTLDTPAANNNGASASGFSDMAGNWAENDVIYLQKNNIIRNEGSQYFPNRNITRAEFAVYLTRVMGLPEDNSIAAKFGDLDSGKSYYKEALSAAASGIILGKGTLANGKEKFSPDEPITRQEMAVMINRALSSQQKAPAADASKLNQFKDKASIASWATEGCAVTVQAGIMGGKADSTFAPKATTTRAEAASILARLHTYSKKVQATA